MQVRRALLPFAIFVCLLAGTASGQIVRVAPNPLPYGVVEEYMTIYGDNLGGEVQTIVTFNGPAGEFTLEANFWSSTQVIVFIPFDVAFTAGQYTVTILAVDFNGSRTIGPASFTVSAAPDVDLPPLIYIPEFVLAEAESSQGATVEYYVASTSADGNVELTPTCAPASGENFPLGFTTVQCSVSDDAGTTSGSFVVYVTDTLPPVVTVPANIVTDDPVVTFTATAVDAIQGELPVSCSPASGATFPTGPTSVACIATDSHFNVGAAFFIVTVTNGTPLLNLPADIEAEATSAAGAVVTYTANAEDGSTVICNPASGSTFALGITTVNCSATNMVGTSTGSFKVTVVDTTPPVMNGAGDIIADATSPAGANVTYTVTSVDLVDGTRPVTCTPASGSFFNFGETTLVSCSSSDTRGNSAQYDFNVTVLDLSPPTVTSIEVSPKTLWPPDHKMIPITVTVTATDVVDPAPVSTITSITSNQPINGTGDGDMAPDWAITGALTAQLRAERSSGVDRIYTITVTTTDASGNSTLSTIQVKVTNTKSRSAR